MAGLVFNSLLRAMAGPVMALMTALLLNGVQGEQLRSAVSALHYNVTLLPVLENPRLCGHVSMDFKSLDELYSMAMHVANMTIVDVSIASVDSPAEDPRARTEEVCFEALLQPFADRHSTHSIRVQWYTVDRQREIVSLHFSEPLSRGGLYRISMYYLAQMSDDHRGFFRLSYVPDGQCAKRYGHHLSLYTCTPLGMLNNLIYPFQCLSVCLFVYDHGSFYKNSYKYWNIYFFLFWLKLNYVGN